jgi:hypothetical protein
VTQLGQERWQAGLVPALAAPLPVPPGRPVRIEPGTLMEKQIPLSLVEPYLTSQRWVIAGFVYRASDAALSGPVRLPGNTADFWILRWRALDLQIYVTASPAVAGNNPDRTAAELYIEPGPIPVGTEMYRVTPAGGEFIARHDGQAWLRPSPQGR